MGLVVNCLDLALRDSDSEDSRSDHTVMKRRWTTPETTTRCRLSGERNQKKGSKVQRTVRYYLTSDHVPPQDTRREF